MGLKKDLEAQAGSASMKESPALEKEVETGSSSRDGSTTQGSSEWNMEEREKKEILIETSDPETPSDELQRVPTAASGCSKKSRLSRIFSKANNKNVSLQPVTLQLTDLGRGVIGWDSQDDRQMPLNFAVSRKWAMIWSIALITFMTPFASSILAPAITALNKDFGNEDLTVGSLPVTIYLLGFTIGPLFLSPLSEIYGRAPVLKISNVFFCCWLVGCALAPTLNALIVMRLLTGLGGSACLTLGAGFVADLFPLEQRGRALSVWTVGPLLGPTIGPIAGGFITDTIGWRWAFWIALIPSAILTVLMLIFLKETNHKVLMQRKVNRLKRELGRDDLISCYENTESRAQSSTSVLLSGLLRPTKMLCMSPLVFFSSLYVAFVSGLMYMLYNTIPMVFMDNYGFSTGEAGLAVLSMGIGNCVGLAVFAHTSDKTVIRMTKANDGVFEPEMRLVSCAVYACILPITFFWYGWSAEYKTHWIVPVLGLFPFGFGMLGIWQPIQTYIIDSYPQYAASGVAAFTVLRSVVSAFLPMAAPRMFAQLGLGWGNSLLGFLCMAMIPVPLLIYKFGGSIRKRQNLKL